MSSSSIFVAVRVRPFIKEDTALIAASGSKAAPIVSMSTRNNTVHVEGDHAGFRCDAALWGLPDLADRDGNPAVGQAVVYDRTARPILDTALEGYNGCVLAYGQTGSGKTFTMMGAGAFENPNALPETAGVIPRLCADLFARTQAIATETAGELTWTVEASYVEVYLEKVTDLLAPPVSRRPGDGPASIAVREDLGGAFVLVGATRTRVASLADVMRLLERGAAQRRTAATNMNEHSSRSHALLYLYLTETLTVPPAQPGAAPMSATSRRVQLKLVDLAGSERANETGATGDRLREAQAINRSLFTLGNVIDVLSGGGGGGPAAGNGSAGARASVTRMTPPYRDSVLTKLLKDCLGGNSKTVMIAAIGPGEPFRSQTVSTLNYATRARRVMNLAVACEDPQAAELRRNQEELRRVKAELDEARRTAADAVAAASAAATQSAGATAEEVSAAAAAAAAEAAAAEAARIALLEAQLAEQQGRMEADQAQAHRRDAQLEQQRKDLDALAAETADAEARCVAQAAALKDAERKFQQERADADAALVDAQRRTTEAQRALAAQTAAADVERAGLERQRTDALMRLEQLEADRQARQRELDDLAGREAALLAQMEQHKRELQLKESALLRLQDESSALQRRRADGVNAARSLTDELLERIRALEAENLLLRRGVRPCPRCTVEVSITDKTCGVCGSPLPSLAPPVANVSGSPNSRSYSVSQ